MLKLPFFNRKRYIVVKAYTDNERILDYTPVQLTSGLPPCKFLHHKVPKQSPYNEENTKLFPSFRTCYANVKNGKRSFTLPSWSSFDIEVDNNLKLTVTGGSESIKIDYEHNKDWYFDNSNFFIVKMVPMWMVEEDTGVDFLYAPHLRDYSNFNTTAGLLNFKHQHSINVFNYVAKFPHKYNIPVQNPLLAFYPISDKPLHVESYFDADRYNALQDKSGYRFHRHASTLKLAKLKRP